MALPRLSALALALVVSLAPVTSAFGREYLAAEPFSGKKIRIDGALGDWPAGFEAMDARISAPAPTASGLVGYDDQFIYVAAKAKTGKIMRSASPGPGQDKVTLELYFPGWSEGQAGTHKIDVYPGVPGKVAAAVLVDGKTAGGAQAVEAVTESGFELEAKIPWSALSRARRTRVGLHGRLTYQQGKGGAASTSGKLGREMPPLTLGPETGLIQNLLETRGIRAKADREILGDINGTGQASRVALYDHFLSITGPTYRDGKEFYVSELDVSRASQVRALRLFDLNGDKKQDIVIQKRLGSSEKNFREVLQVFQVNADGTLAPLFLAEVGISTPDGSIENKVEFKATDGQLWISQGDSEGFNPGNYREPRFSDGPAALLPWEKVGTRVFGYKDGRVTLLEEKPWTPKFQMGSMAGSPRASAPSSSAPAEAAPSADRVLALYKKDRGLPSYPVHFDGTIDLAGDSQKERALVIGKDILVFGKGFKRGLSYSYITLPIHDARDVVRATTQSITKDGKSVIMVTVRMEAKTGPGPEAETVKREVVLFYRLEGEKLVRIFAVETAREVDDKRVESELRFVSGGPQGSMKIELRSAKNRGFTRKNYPFGDELKGTSGIEPVVLPWTSKPVRRFKLGEAGYQAE